METVAFPDASVLPTTQQQPFSGFLERGFPGSPDGRDRTRGDPLRLLRCLRGSYVPKTRQGFR